MLSRRSKLMSCPRKGRLLRFQSKSTDFSDGWAQKVGNNLWHGSESITIKVRSQISLKWKAMFDCKVKTCIAGWYSIFNSKFLSLSSAKCYNICQKKENCNHEFWNILSNLDILLEQSDMKMLHAKSGSKFARHDDSFPLCFRRLIQTHWLSS